MRSRKAKRSRFLLLFFVIIEVLVAGLGLYRWGRQIWERVGCNLSVRMYDRVLSVCLPGYLCVQDSTRRGLYRDLTAAMYPAVAANEMMLWYEAKEGAAESVDLADAGAIAVDKNLNDCGGSTGDRKLDGHGGLAGDRELNGGEEPAGDGNTEDYEKLALAENADIWKMMEENQKGAEGEKSDIPVLESPVLPNPDIANPGPTRKQSGKGTDAKTTKVNRKKLKDFDYLLQNFYQVDNTTTIGKNLLDAEKLLAYDMTVDMNTDGPQILIYHTHSQEGFKNSVEGDASTTVVGLGDRLTELLEGYGYKVLHDRGVYDKPRARAYSTAAPNIEKILKKNPSIQVVIDLHRDGVSEDVHLVTEQNGKKMAKIMFFNGLSHTTAAGDIPYLKNPYIKDNLAFSLQMQLAAAEAYPDFTRRIYLKGYRFNMHFCPKSLLVEVGAQTNTVEEVMNSMEPLSDVLNRVLSGNT